MSSLPQIRIVTEEENSRVEVAELRRLSELLREIEEEAVRLVEGTRGASTLAIVSRAASARRFVESVLGEPTPLAAVHPLQSVERDCLRRIRVAVQELHLSASAAANRVGATEEEMERILQGTAGVWPLELLDRVARRLEGEQQLEVL
jgi:hypothetical protein